MTQAQSAGWPRLARAGAAFCAGAIGALGQAPFDVPVAMLISLCLGFALWRAAASRAGEVGWAFGLGYFALALVWILQPFQVDAARHGWMAPFALFFLSGGLALFWGGAFWLARRLPGGAAALVLTWTAAEMLRAYVLTGFPWASPAQVAIHGPVSYLLALGGPHLVTFAMLALAAVLTVPAPPRARWRMRTGQLALLVGAGLAFSLPHARTAAPPSERWVRLIQPNVPQDQKWRPELAEVFFERQIALTEAPAVGPAQPPALIVWPETAIPWRLETAEPVLQRIALAGGGAPVVLGVLRAAEDGLRNALAVIDDTGGVRAVYDKYHLVPFGEYIPFRSVADRLGLRALAASMGGFSKGPGPRLLDLGPLGQALPLICYEAVFAHGVNAAPARPDFLLQITNDAWFGTYAGPQQHLAQARMRAIEQGLPLMRAANTGISAMIGPTGRVLASLPLGQAGFLDAALPRALPPTLYSRTGDWPVLFLLVFGAVLTVCLARINCFDDSD